ncbi:LysR family transcriptional regulator, partial [Lactococcus garvieae]|nr:LysR family transcriptional regulator [Lactococcus garvieae]
MQYFQISNVHNDDHYLLWSYTIKVDRKLCVIICLLRHKNERT